jgi:hypothetical protein
MRAYRKVLLTAFAVLLAAAVLAPVLNADANDNAVPFMRRVEPAVVKAGEEATVYGDALDKTKVADVMLTNDTRQIRVDVVEQTATMIKFIVPADTEPGKYNPTVLMVKEPMLLVQPVVLTVKPAK